MMRKGFIGQWNLNAHINHTCHSYVLIAFRNRQRLKSKTTKAITATIVISASIEFARSLKTPNNNRSQLNWAMRNGLTADVMPSLIFIIIITSSNCFAEHIIELLWADRDRA